MIVTGMLMRAAGFATMGIAHEPWLLWFSCLLSGLGGTLFDPPRSALVVKLIRPQQRGRFFSLLMMQDSAGAVIGALLGSWLLQYDFRLVCATGAVLFVLCAAFNAWLLPAWKLSTVRTPVREGMTRVMRDKRFVTYVLTLAGYYMLAVQVMLMLPIMVNDVAGAPSAVKWMYAIEACLSLTLLYPIARWSEKHFRLEHRLMAGLLIMSLEQIKAAAGTGVQIGIVIGGGNIFRGLTGAKKGFDRVKGDQMGMLATIINSLALQSALEDNGVKAKVLTSIRMEPIGEYYSKARAIEYLEAGYVVIIGGGTSNPYFTTDSASALRGIEIEADVMLKGTRVDGVYTADPEKDPTAVKFDRKQDSGIPHGFR